MSKKTKGERRKIKYNRRKELSTFNEMVAMVLVIGVVVASLGPVISAINRSDK
jgi:hypothetical protein